MILSAADYLLAIKTHCSLAVVVGFPDVVRMHVLLLQAHCWFAPNAVFSAILRMRY